MGHSAGLDGGNTYVQETRYPGETKTIVPLGYCFLARNLKATRRHACMNMYEYVHRYRGCREVDDFIQTRTSPGICKLIVMLWSHVLLVRDACVLMKDMGRKLPQVLLVVPRPTRRFYGDGQPTIRTGILFFCRFLGFADGGSKFETEQSMTLLAEYTYEYE